MSNSPNKQTADDMLKAAQTRASNQPVRSRESREVVVRKDGTKVVKVRRRKRKSQAPSDILKRSEEQNKKFYIKLALIFMGVGGLLSLVFGLIFFFKVAYFNSPNYITELEKSMEERLDSSVVLEGYRLGPTTSVIDKVSINHASPTLGDLSLELKNLCLTHRPETVVFGQLSGEDSQAEEARLSINIKSDKERVEQKQIEFSQKYIHNYERLNILKAQIYLGDPKLEHTLKVKDSSATVLLREDGSFQSFLRTGTMVNTPGLPKFLNSAIVINHEAEYEIKALKFGNGSTGSLNITGNLSKDFAKTQELNCEFDQLRLEESNAEVANLVEASVSANDGSLTINPKNGVYRIKSDVSVSAAGFSLKGFEFLSSFAEIFGDFSYPYVAFRTRNKVTLDIDTKRYSFKDIYFEQQGLLAVSGEINIFFDGSLSGGIKVGIPTTKVLKQYPELDLKRLEDSRGYLWFPTQLSGTTLIPRDDFKKQFNKVIDTLQ